MSIYYDEILAGNCFGQINVTTPTSVKTTAQERDQSIKMTSATDSSLVDGINGEKMENGTIVHEQHTVLDDLGFSTTDLYNMAKQFLKEKEGTKAIQLGYRDKQHLVALSKQAAFGKYQPQSAKQVGFLDVIGNDRRQAWIELGDMSSETAKKKFIELLSERCSMFRPYLEAHCKDNEEKERLRQEDEKRRILEQEAERDRRKQEEEVIKLEDIKKKREEQQKKQIQDALNQQTYPQFKAYAEQQHRDNLLAQEDLIRQLQEQHFQQYMSQVYQQQLFHQQQQIKAASASATPTQNKQQPSSSAMENSINSQQWNTSGSYDHDQEKIEKIQSDLQSMEIKNTTTTPPSSIVETSTSQTGSVDLGNFQPIIKPENDSIDGGSMISVSKVDETAPNTADEQLQPAEEVVREYPPIAPANMWTRKDIKEFKEHVRKEKDAVIKIGSGETVTVRVPTHEDGRCIFWEFATDYYDIGFGLYFEWTKAQSNTVTVHVSDSSEEEEEGEEGAEKKDVEKGRKAPKPYQDEIIPIFRRDCQEEIYAGNHPYPGDGVYLLKFDNSYSLWRSKTLYYRVYYSR